MRWTALGFRWFAAVMAALVLVSVADEPAQGGSRTPLRFVSFSLAPNGTYVPGEQINVEAVIRTTERRAVRGARFEVFLTRRATMTPAGKAFASRTLPTVTARRSIISTVGARLAKTSQGRYLVTGCLRTVGHRRVCAVLPGKLTVARCHAPQGAAVAAGSGERVVWTRRSSATTTRTWWACLDRRHRRVRILSAPDDDLERHTELYGWRFAGRYAVAAWSRVRDHYDPGFSGFTRVDLARGAAWEVELGEPVGASLPPSATVAQLAVNHDGRVLALTTAFFTDPAGTLRLFDPQMSAARVLAHARGIANLRLTSTHALWTEVGVPRSAAL